jgi:UDP-3-O-[3-hydroxymyristoyl] N-acetylglucosamine deacetylase/3-hydroxyacyl-[acyl-carrier-protein] dehydratase
LAALVGLKIDNCKIELSSNEPPVLDGSSMPYVEALIKAGAVDLDTPREYFHIGETVHYANEAKAVDIVALPTDSYRITVMVDYFNPALGSQHTGMFDLEKEFVTEFAPARTFCFLTEVEMLYKAGLIRGGSIDNALIIVDKEIDNNEYKDLMSLLKVDGDIKVGSTGILNDTDLRFKNEPARHKLLDMLGDLALIGVPIKAQILAARPGHASNFEFAKMIRKLYLKKLEEDRYDPAKSPGESLNIAEIMDILPHRYPFLLVDRVMEINVEKTSVLAYKNVSINEEFFLGHFPGKPVMPGVLILEALAQTGGILISKLVEDFKKKLALFMGINNVKFRRPVVPGDQLVLEAIMVRKKFNTYTFNCKAFVNKQIVAEAELQAALVDKES